MKHILRCPECLQFTMQDTCARCACATEQTKPAKYSPDDKYKDLKRQAKEEERTKQGLL